MGIFGAVIAMFRRIFNRRALTKESDSEKNQLYALEYSSTAKVNLTAIVANKLANLMLSDGDVRVQGDNERAALISATVKDFERRFSSVVSDALGIGGVVLLPRAINGRLQIDMLPQDRLIVLDRQGARITSAGILADVIERDNRKYLRVEYHQLLPNGLYVIEQRALMGSLDIPLSAVPEWAELPERVEIQNVTDMLFALLRCPLNDRTQNAVYGVPITFGQNELIRKIQDILDSFQREINLKDAFIGVSDMLFDKNNSLPTNGIFKKFTSANEDFFEIFSPEIRVDSYISALNYYFELLEKAIGVNKGVLTNLDTVQATATAIRRSTADTYALVDAIRREFENAMRTLCYGLDVLANAASITLPGEWDLVFDWGYSLIEDSAETWSQYVEAVNLGLLRPEEARAWLMSEDKETALERLPEMTRLTGA